MISLKDGREGVMDYLDVLVPVIALDTDEGALRAASDLAVKAGGRATALIVGVWLGSEYAHEQRPLSDALADLVAGARSASATERGKIVTWIERHHPQLDVRDATIESAAALDEIVVHARMADLVVLAASERHKRARRELLEDVLFKSGRPILLLPTGSRRADAWDRILIAWNASAEVTRAVVNALPLLKAASHVRIVTVDAAPGKAGYGEAPGRELAAYLARRGVRAEVSNLDGLGRDHAQRLSEAALDFSADMIVMGAYGHSRAREFILGGVTRDLLGAPPLPLFLSH
jgi:nucleotide-binding universal stress UspA family protein